MSFRLLKRFNFLNRNCSHETTRSAKNSYPTSTPPLPHLYPTCMCFRGGSSFRVLKWVLKLRNVAFSVILNRFNFETSRKRACELFHSLVYPHSLCANYAYIRRLMHAKTLTFGTFSAKTLRFSAKRILWTTAKPPPTLRIFHSFATAKPQPTLRIFRS
jgi:hypothetical protein